MQRINKVFEIKHGMQDLSNAMVQIKQHNKCEKCGGFLRIETDTAIGDAIQKIEQQKCAICGWINHLNRDKQAVAIEMLHGFANGFRGHGEKRRGRVMGNRHTISEVATLLHESVEQIESWWETDKEKQAQLELQFTPKSEEPDLPIDLYDVNQIKAFNDKMDEVELVQSGHFKGDKDSDSYIHVEVQEDEKQYEMSDVNVW